MKGGITEDRSIKVLLDNKVTVKGTVTKEMMEALGNDIPTLSFTAYAHQLYENEKGDEFTPAEAWENISEAAGN